MPQCQAQMWLRSRIPTDGEGFSQVRDTELACDKGNSRATRETGKALS